MGQRVLYDILNEHVMHCDTEGSSHYKSERNLTHQNINNTIKAIKSDGVRVVEMVHAISFSGKAKQNDMALFVLVLCLTHGDLETKRAVENIYTDVVRTGTDQLIFVEFIDSSTSLVDPRHLLIDRTYVWHHFLDDPTNNLYGCINRQTAVSFLVKESNEISKRRLNATAETVDITFSIILGFEDTDAAGVKVVSVSQG